MRDFKSYLIREKIKFDNLPAHIRNKIPAIGSIRSNRVDFELETSSGLCQIVVRAQNTHITMRFTAEVIRYMNANSAGDLTQIPKNTWQSIWERSLSTYEKEFNGNKIWALLYINGVSVFGTHKKTIADIIEKCAASKRQEYEYNADFVEYIMKEYGWDITVVHENTIAGMVFKDNKMIKGSINPRRGIDNRIFSFRLMGDILDINRVYAAFLLESLFLETGNLNFQIDKWREMIEDGELQPRVPQVRQFNRATQHLKLLIREIKSIENNFNISYRPERPEFLK